MDRDAERAQMVHEVVQKFRALELGPVGGVLAVVLRGEGIPQEVVGRLGFVVVTRGFTAEAVKLMNELRGMEQSPQDRELLIEAYEVWLNKREDEDYEYEGHYEEDEA